jgi:hypothetical protein
MKRPPVPKFSSDSAAKAAKKITAIFEEYLNNLPVEEREARLEAFERGVAKNSREKRSCATPATRRPKRASRGKSSRKN